MSGLCIHALPWEATMRTVLVVAALGLALAGCRTTEEVAAADDATCRGYGAQPGTDLYVQCRMMQDERRSAERIARNQSGSSGVAAGLALMNGGSVGSSPTTCTTRPSPLRTSLTTTCY